jgi:archaellum component FlaF (FlaF/FlaG flagellin family)
VFKNIIAKAKKKEKKNCEEKSLPITSHMNESAKTKCFNIKKVDVGSLVLRKAHQNIICDHQHINDIRNISNDLMLNNIINYLFSCDFGSYITVLTPEKKEIKNIFTR